MAKKLFSLNNLLQLLPIVLIILIAAILRFWNVPELFSFGIDEEYQSLLAWAQVKDFHPIWIGVSAANTGFYLGPGFTYINAVLFMISHGDPVILGYASAVLGLFTTASIYFIVNTIFGKRAAVIASLLYATSTLMIFYDRRFWNASPLSFLSIWMVFSLIQARKDSRWLILSSVIMAASYHSHISFWIFYPVIFIVVFSVIKKITWWTWLAMIVAFAVIVSPLIVYDFVHNFDNLTMPLRFLKGSTATQTSFDLIKHINELFSALSRMWFMKPYGSITDESVPGAMILKTTGPLFIGVISCILILYATAKSKLDSQKILLSVVLLFIIAFIIYPGNVAEYYLLGLFPLIFIVAALYLQYLKNFVLIIFLTSFILLNSISLFTTSNDYGLTAKKKLIQEVSSYIKDSPFSLETLGSYRTFGGWRYLFKAYGKTPAKSSADELFGWIYPDELTSKEPEYKVIVTDATIGKDPLLVKRFRSKGFSAYILRIN